MSISQRYANGDHLAVWDEIVRNLTADPSAAQSPEIGAVTFATFTQIRVNIDRIIDALSDAGYRFQSQAEDLAPRRLTSDKAMATLRKAGAPFTLIAFAEIVGTVDLRHAFDGARGALADLGNYDPMFFDPGYFAADYADKSWRAAQEAATPGHIRIEFAPDAFHKANVSGGTGYCVTLPTARPDPRVEPLGITFLAYLRKVIAQGGFLGTAEPVGNAATWSALTPDADGYRLPHPAAMADIQARMLPF